MSWPQPGSVVDGRYEVEDLLGEGGMGVVVRARHRFTGARVALKMLHGHLRLRPDLATRFLAEARAPAAIGHPGIVSVTDGGVTPEGDPYFAMELLAGEPLAGAMRRGPMPFETIRRITLEILDALGAAHAAGFVHRDLKPENVFVTQAGGVKLLDFGIAKSLGDLDTASATATGTTMGTLYYMSPEQLRNAKRVDYRTDLWAVGVMLQQMLTGELPFVAESLGDMLMLVLSTPPPPLASRLAYVPPELDAVVRRALAVDPAQRFSSAAEMAHAVASLPPLELDPSRAGPAMGPAGFVSVPPTVTGPPQPPPVVLTEAEPPPQQVSDKTIAIWGISGLVAFGGALLVVLTLVAAVVFLPRAKARARAGRPAGAAAAANACERACRTIRECGASFDLAGCAADCRSKPALEACVANANDCDDVGACMIQSVCGAKPSGNRSCRATANCEASCDVKNSACVCGCLLQTSPSKAGEITVNNSCGFSKCREQCMGPGASSNACNFCYANHCGSEMGRCQND